VRLNETDVMRHKLVKKIIVAYKQSDEQEAAWREEKRRERGVE
jgi:phosphate starvation-inducible protein PhoH